MTMSADAARGGSGPLDIDQGDLDERTYREFLKQLDVQAAAICAGVQLALEDQDVKTTVHERDGTWHLDVGRASGTTADPDPPRTRIHIRANTADVPRIVNSLNRFFGNWRAVGGVVAIGAAYVAGSWLMILQRRQ